MLFLYVFFLYISLLAIQIVRPSRGVKQDGATRDVVSFSFSSVWDLPLRILVMIISYEQNACDYKRAFFLGAIEGIWILGKENMIRLSLEAGGIPLFFFFSPILLSLNFFLYIYF
jgi:hypothetical protein